MPDYRKTNGPVVSCVMVTQPGRERLAGQAIEDYHAQSWPHKELIIIEEMGPTLGELRNKGIDSAAGDFVVQWDDDDRYHPDRIARQLMPLLENPCFQACCLSSQILEMDGREYTLNWNSPIPGTILHRKSCAARYPTIRRSEDTEFLKLISSIFTIPGKNLYRRRFHGNNTWDKKHFEGLLYMFRES